jgi:CHAT domain-containing protein
LQRLASLFGLRRGVAPMAVRGLADVDLLRAQLPLPETRDELCAIARDLKADPGEMRLGARATEREVKRLSARGALAQYRIVHFATHGVLAGQLDPKAESGLILTPPETASEEDDGYLTASEIAALKLDADWVILSACNTAAGGATGAEALSGLARVFFYAQARALLVSHWEVDSDATVKLIIGAVSEIALDKRVGRAEALRRAMLAMIDGASRKRRIPPIGHRLCSWAKARRRASGYVCNCVAEPDRMVGGLPLRLRVGRIVSRALVGGLHHQYVRI